VRQTQGAALRTSGTPPLCLGGARRVQGCGAPRLTTWPPSSRRRHHARRPRETHHIAWRALPVRTWPTLLVRRWIELCGHLQPPEASRVSGGSTKRRPSRRVVCAARSRRETYRGQPSLPFLRPRRLHGHGALAGNVSDITNDGVV